MTDVQEPAFLTKVENGEPLTVWEQIEYDEYCASGSPSETRTATGRIRNGVHLALEEAADALIFKSLSEITSREAKMDVLTPWKLKNRYGKEVYSANGFPDSSIRQGMYHRVLNRAMPWLNSRDGHAQNAARQVTTIAMTHFTGSSDD